MDNSAWEREWRLAVAAGLVTQDQAGHIRDKATTKSPLEWLRDEGYLSAASFCDFRRQLASPGEQRSGPDAPESTTQPTHPQDEATASPQPGDIAPQPFSLAGAHWGRFQLGSLLGQGGMGRVYKAYDPKLKRHVALKMLSVQDPRMVRRFVHEARAQARVEHDRVCKVYEVGESERGPFIAMQLIEGLPLHKMSPRMGLEDKLSVMQQVAQAVHEAHRAGLIHRDLKPGNIMVERTEGGHFKPFVLDFGLARGPVETGMTLDGAVMGTPHYMSPEQARGENDQLDRRSDVYGLGATLYHILLDEPPFARVSPGEVFHYIMEREVPPLRKSHPEIPAEVACIVLKCMAKDRSKRYDSARALAEDLGRFLDGEPILANPPSLRYRLSKRVRRNRLAFTVGAVALVLILLLSAWGIYTSWHAKTREKLIADFSSRVVEMDTLARLSSTVPAHDIRPDQALIRATMERVRLQAGQFGTLGAGPGAYALGRGHLALGDFAGARLQLESAWRYGYREPAVAYSLSRVYGELYRRALWENQLQANGLQRDAQRRELERLYRDPALQFMRRTEAASPGRSAYLQAMIAFCESRFEDALGLLQAAPERSAWFNEPLELAGDIYRARAGEKLSQGGYAEAGQDFGQALQEYQRAARHGESDPGLFRAIAEVHLERLVMIFFGDDEIGPVMRAGLEAVDTALSLNPDDVATLVLQSRFLYTLAEYHMSRSENPGEFLTLAGAAAARAERLGGHASKPQKASAIAYWNLARWALAGHEDPMPLIEKSLDAFARVAAGDRDAEYYNKLGSAHILLARFQARSGQPAEQAWTQAEAAYRQATARFPDQAVPFINLGIYCHDRASFLAGEARTRLFREGLRALDRARAIDPNHLVTCYYLGRIHGALALDSPAASRELYFEAAVAGYEEGLSLNPAMVHLLSGLGEVFYNQALDLWDRGGAPGPLFERAIATYWEALRVDPDYVHTYINLSWALLDQGRCYFREGVDPRACFLEAAHSAEEALACGVRDIPLLSLGGARLGQAELAFHQEEDPDAYLEQAGDRFQQFLAINQRWDYPYRGLGEVATLRARLLIAQGAEPSQVAAAFQRAHRFLEEAIERDDQDDDNERALARLALFQSHWLADRGGSAEAFIEQGLAAMGRIRATEKDRLESEAMGRCFHLLRIEGPSEGKTNTRAALEKLLVGSPFLRKELSAFLD